MMTRRVVLAGVIACLALLSTVLQECAARVVAAPGSDVAAADFFSQVTCPREERRCNRTGCPRAWYRFNECLTVDDGSTAVVLNCTSDVARGIGFLTVRGFPASNNCTGDFIPMRQVVNVCFRNNEGSFTINECAPGAREVQQTPGAREAQSSPAMHLSDRAIED